VRHIRVWQKRTDSKSIYVQMVEKFGCNSEEVKGINGIAPSVGNTWIISYTVKSGVPSGLVGSDFVLNGNNLEFEDDSESWRVYSSKRADQIYKASEAAVREMTFRIQGLPLDVKQAELFSELNRFGYGIHGMNQIRQSYDKTS